MGGLGSHLNYPITNKFIQRRANLYYRVSSAEMQGYRTTMEDMITISISESPDGVSFFGVFDGHAGSECSEFLSRTFYEKVLQLENPSDPEHLVQVCLALDNLFLQKSPHPRESGSTACFAVIKPIFPVEETDALISSKEIILGGKPPSTPTAGPSASPSTDHAHAHAEKHDDNDKEKAASDVKQKQQTRPHSNSVSGSGGGIGGSGSGGKQAPAKGTVLKRGGSAESNSNVADAQGDDDDDKPRGIRHLSLLIPGNLGVPAGAASASGGGGAGGGDDDDDEDAFRNSSDQDRGSDASGGGGGGGGGGEPFRRELTLKEAPSSLKQHQFSPKTTDPNPNPNSNNLTIPPLKVSSDKGGDGGDDPFDVPPVSSPAAIPDSPFVPPATFHRDGTHEGTQPLEGHPQHGEPHARRHQPEDEEDEEQAKEKRRLEQARKRDVGEEEDGASSDERRDGEGRNKRTTLTVNGGGMEGGGGDGESAGVMIGTPSATGSETKRVSPSDSRLNSLAFTAASSSSSSSDSAAISAPATHTHRHSLLAAAVAANKISNSNNNPNNNNNNNDGGSEENAAINNKTDDNVHSGSTSTSSTTSTSTSTSTSSSGGKSKRAPQPRGFEITVGNVGDSRAVLLRANGDWVALTRDHLPTDTKERNRIKAAGGTVSMGRVDGELAMSRAFGDGFYKNNYTKKMTEQKVIAVPEITIAVAEPGDHLLICCDGFFERLNRKQVCEFLHTEFQKTLDDPGRVGCELIDYSLHCGSGDNMSLILISFKTNEEIADVGKVVEDITQHNYDHFVLGQQPPAKNSNKVFTQAFQTDRTRQLARVKEQASSLEATRRKNARAARQIFGQGRGSLSKSDSERSSGTAPAGGGQPSDVSAENKKDRSKIMAALNSWGEFLASPFSGKKRKSGSSSSSSSGSGGGSANVTSPTSTQSPISPALANQSAASSTATGGSTPKNKT